MLADTYNSFVSTFGQKFDEFTFPQLVQFCSLLAQGGLKQEDIYDAVLERLKKITETRRLAFNDIYLPFLKGMVDLNMTESKAFKEITSEEFLKQYVVKERILEDYAKFQSPTDIEKLIGTVFKANLPQTNEVFSKFAKALLEKLATQKLQVNEDTLILYQFF